jgi:hypothetical protein
MIAFHYDRDLDARVATFSQTIDDAELLTAYERLLSSDDYDPALNDLLDMQGIESFDVSGDAIRELVRAFSRINARDSRLAIVASSDLVYGMARMYEQLRSDASEEIRVFREMEPARSWLGQAKRRRVS